MYKMIFSMMCFCLLCVTTSNAQGAANSAFSAKLGALQSALQSHSQHVGGEIEELQADINSIKAQTASCKKHKHATVFTANCKPAANSPTKVVLKQCRNGKIKTVLGQCAKGKDEPKPDEDPKDEIEGTIYVVNERVLRATDLGKLKELNSNSPLGDEMLRSLNFMNTPKGIKESVYYVLHASHYNATSFCEEYGYSEGHILETFTPGDIYNIYGRDLFYITYDDGAFRYSFNNLSKHKAIAAISCVKEEKR